MTVLSTIKPFGGLGRVIRGSLVDSKTKKSVFENDDNVTDNDDNATDNNDQVSDIFDFFDDKISEETIAEETISLNGKFEPHGATMPCGGMVLFVPFAYANSAAIKVNPQIENKAITILKYKRLTSFKKNHENKGAVSPYP